MHLNTKDISAMEHSQRAHLINSLSGFKSANMVGTKDQFGVSNLSIVSSVVNLGTDPAYIAFVHRPNPTERNTLDNILASGVYTLNHVPASLFKDAHHTSASYPVDVSEFAKTNFTEQYTALSAPYVAQSVIKMGVEFRQKIDIELNRTILVIGEIIEILVDASLQESIVQQDGKLDLVAAGSVAVSGLDEYHLAESLGRLAYAKPKQDK